MNKARQAFYTKLVEDNSCNQRTLFRANKRLFNQSQGYELPPNLHAPTFANEVGKYFVSKIDTIQRQIVSDITDLPAFTSTDPLMALLGRLHRYLLSRFCLPTVLSRLSITQH